MSFLKKKKKNNNQNNNSNALGIIKKKNILFKTSFKILM